MGHEMIIGGLMFAGGILWVWVWFQSGATPGKKGETAVTASSPFAGHGQGIAGTIKISVIHAVHPDGVTADLDAPEWPEILRRGIRIRMAGARVPGGKSDAMQFIRDMMRGQLDQILRQARDIRISGISRGQDFALTADLLIDGRVVSPVTCPEFPEEAVKAKQEPKQERDQRPERVYIQVPPGIPYQDTRQAYADDRGGGYEGWFMDHRGRDRAWNG